MRPGEKIFKIDTKLFACEYFNKFSINVCPYTISGDREWVIKKAIEHLINKHGSEDSPDLREEIHNSLIDD